MKIMSTDVMRNIVLSANPMGMDFPISSADRSDRVVRLALMGLTRVAAHDFLHEEMTGHLEETVGNTIRALNIEFNSSIIRLGKKEKIEQSVLTCARAYDVLIQIADR